MNVEKRLKYSLNVFDDLIDFERRRLEGGDFRKFFPDFLRAVIKASREDEKKHIRAKNRVKDLRHLMEKATFFGTDDTHFYSMSIKLLGYETLQEMKDELQEYAPDLLESAVIFNNKGLGSSFLLKNYDGTQDTQGNDTQRRDESKDEEIGSNSLDQKEVQG